MKAVKSAAVPAQLGGVECLFEGSRAAEVLRLEVGQGLPIICESGLRLTLSAGAALAALAAAFARNWNKTATATSKRKRRLSKLTAIMITLC